MRQQRRRDERRRSVVPLHDGAFESGDRRVVEKRTQRQFDFKLRTQLRDDPHRQQRMAAELEETVVQSYPIQMQHLREDPRQAFLQLGVGFGVVGDVGARFRCRQAILVHFAVDRERQRRQHHRRRRQHMFWKTLLQMLAQAAHEGLPRRIRERVVGAGLRIAGLRCGLYCGLILRRDDGSIDEGRRHKSWIGIGPRDADRVTMPFAQQPQRLWLHTLRRQLLRPFAQRPPGVAAVAVAHQIQQCQGRLDPGVGHIGHTHPGRPPTRQMRIQRRQQIIALGTPNVGYGRTTRRRGRVQPDVVAVLIQLVLRIAPLEQDVHAADRGDPLRQGLEERRRHQQFLLLANAGVDRGPQPLDGRVVARPRKLHGGMESFEQAVVADVADEDPPTRHEMCGRATQHIEQVMYAGKVLNDRVQHDGVEVQRQIGEIGGGLRREPHVRQTVRRSHPPPQARDRDRGQVGAEIRLAMRRQPLQYQTDAAADLENPLRMTRKDPLGRRLQPLSHLVFGNGCAGITAMPPDEARTAILLRRLIRLLIDRLPLRDALVRARVEVRRLCWYDVCDQTRFAAVIPLGDDSLPNPGMAQQGRLDLAQFDAEAAQFDLLVDATEIFHLAVRRAPDQIAAAIKPLARRERACDETGRRQRSAVEITPGQACARNVELTRRTIGDRPQRFVQDVGPQMRQRLADRASWRLDRFGGAHCALGDMHRRFGDAVHVHQFRRPVAVALEPAAKLTEAQRFAAEDHQAQLQRQTLGIVDRSELPERRRRLVEHGDAFPAHECIERLGVPADVSGYHDEPAAIQQRAPHFPNRKIERVRVEQGPDVLRAESETRLRGVEQGRHVRLWDEYTLGLAGRSRRVDHVGQCTRRKAPLWQGRRRVPEMRVVAIEPHDRAFRDAIRDVQARAQAALGQQQPRPAVVEHEGGPGLGRARIDRQIRRARLEDGQHADDQQRRSIHAQADDVFGSDTEQLQLARQRRRTRVQFAISESRLAVAQRDRVRRALDLRREPLQQHPPTGLVVALTSRGRLATGVRGAHILHQASILR